MIVKTRSQTGDFSSERQIEVIFSSTEYKVRVSNILNSKKECQQNLKLAHLTNKTKQKNQQVLSPKQRSKKRKSQIKSRKTHKTSKNISWNIY